MDQQIRAVVIACAAIEAKAADGARDARLVRSALGSQLEKLFALMVVRRDAKNQLGEGADRSFLDFPKDRVRRLQHAIGALVHVEAWAAAHSLKPISPEFVPQLCSIKKLVATGLFSGAETPEQLRAATDANGARAFTEKELCVLGGFCGAPMQPGESAPPVVAPVALAPVVAPVALAPVVAPVVALAPVVAPVVALVPVVAPVVALAPVVAPVVALAPAVAPVDPEEAERAKREAKVEAKRAAIIEAQKREQLLHAAEIGDVDKARDLIARGVCVDHTDKQAGFTPLSWAAQQGHDGIANVLLEAGAQKDNIDKGGWTPLMRVRRSVATPRSCVGCSQPARTRPTRLIKASGPSTSRVAPGAPTRGRGARFRRCSNLSAERRGAGANEPRGSPIAISNRSSQDTPAPSFVLASVGVF